jgi:hypothetical protein
VKRSTGARRWSEPGKNAVSAGSRSGIRCCDCADFGAPCGGLPGAGTAREPAETAQITPMFHTIKWTSTSGNATVEDSGGPQQAYRPALPAGMQSPSPGPLSEA